METWGKKSRLHLVKLLLFMILLTAKDEKTHTENGWRMHAGRKIPWNLFSPKVPFRATLVPNHQHPQMLMSTGDFEIHHLTLSHHGKVKFLEGQSIGVLPTVTASPNAALALVRLYPIASSRAGDDQRSKTFSLCVKRVLAAKRSADGVMTREDEYQASCSNYLCSLKLGDKVTITGPMGRELLLPEDLRGHTLIFVARDLGLAPVRAHLRRLLHDRKEQGSFDGAIRVVFAGHEMYEDEMNAYESSYPKNFRYSSVDDLVELRNQLLKDGEELWNLLQKPSTHLLISGGRDLDAMMAVNL
ncbi:unnamed protein product [Durusdinium trenchii]|uniref:ferredoxin--NADP(+) reductase n=1 Tax=Durusdinium trenchii TaxID=1381693 RepID=A0ABP0I8M5_9DINO